MRLVLSSTPHLSSTLHRRSPTSFQPVTSFQPTTSTSSEPISFSTSRFGAL